ncbi:hypothetical protein [Rhodococcus sp. IEGM 1379]|uniref:hypothetical protein n=1 Tax=Rhodococcus sp. IEGM 1379 TaxID=3047086 RepID=UPI0024B67F42|nr:hypothetical protein [Rhodococcus sp. IEGM 1379]MDI9914885.1 hypothetical protein [Rhodococcus sp. IEGM 1379]
MNGIRGCSRIRRAIGRIGRLPRTADKGAVVVNRETGRLWWQQNSKESYSSGIAIDAAHNEPEWATQRWAEHTDLHHLGSDVLHRLWFGTQVSKLHLEEWESRYLRSESV